MFLTTPKTRSASVPDACTFLAVSIAKATSSTVTAHGSTVAAHVARTPRGPTTLQDACPQVLRRTSSWSTKHALIRSCQWRDSGLLQYALCGPGCGAELSTSIVLRSVPRSFTQVVGGCDAPTICVRFQAWSGMTIPSASSWMFQGMPRNSAILRASRMNVSRCKFMPVASEFINDCLYIGDGSFQLKCRRAALCGRRRVEELQDSAQISQDVLVHRNVGNRHKPGAAVAGHDGVKGTTWLAPRASADARNRNPMRHAADLLVSL